MWGGIFHREGEGFMNKVLSLIAELRTFGQAISQSWPTLLWSRGLEFQLCPSWDGPIEVTQQVAELEEELHRYLDGCGFEFSSDWGEKIFVYLPDPNSPLEIRWVHLGPSVRHDSKLIFHRADFEIDYENLGSPEFYGREPAECVADIQRLLLPSPGLSIQPYVHAGRQYEDDIVLCLGFKISAA